MRITFTRTNVAAYAGTIDAIIASYEPKWAGLTPAGRQGFIPCFEGANQCLTYDREADAYTYAINDDVILRVLSLYVKVANVVSPLVKHIVNVAKLFKPRAMDLKAMVDSELAAINDDMLDGISPIEGYVIEQDEDEGLDIRTTAQGDPVLAN